MAKIAKVKDTKEVFGTGKSKFFPKGKSRTMNAILADKLIEAGKATDKQTKDK